MKREGTQPTAACVRVLGAPFPPVEDGEGLSEGAASPSRVQVEGEVLCPRLKDPPNEVCGNRRMFGENQ